MSVSHARGTLFLPPGTRLGNYELIRGVAVGGMAELYLARTVAVETFDRLVALKRILPQYASDEEFVRMFLDEARLTAKLQHPNIAQVYDIGTDRNGLFFTMEFIHGENVQTILRTADIAGTRLPLAQALAIAVGVAAGLHAAHEQRGADGELLKIVHRDISPSNVIVSFDGGVKLIDFGVAKARGRQTTTRDGTIKGKISYMSPEQCRGEPLDRRSDVFALGILLYELTTTQRLFIGENEFAVLKRIVYKDAPLPSERVPGYPPELEAIVMRALSRNIGRRYASARDLESDLLAFAREQSLDISTSALGKYMRQAFPEGARAWERATAMHSGMRSMAAPSDAGRAAGGDPPAATEVIAEEVIADLEDFEIEVVPDELLAEPLTPDHLTAEPLTPDAPGKAELGRMTPDTLDGEQRTGEKAPQASGQRAVSSMLAGLPEPAAGTETADAAMEMALRPRRGWYRWVAGLAVAGACAVIWFLSQDQKTADERPAGDAPMASEVVPDSPAIHDDRAATHMKTTSPGDLPAQRVAPDKVLPGEALPGAILQTSPQEGDDDRHGEPGAEQPDAGPEKVVKESQAHTREGEMDENEGADQGDGGESDTQPVSRKSKKERSKKRRQSKRRIHAVQEETVQTTSGKEPEQKPRWDPDAPLPP